MNMRKLRERWRQWLPGEPRRMSVLQEMLACLIDIQQRTRETAIFVAAIRKDFLDHQGDVTLMRKVMRGELPVDVLDE